MANLQLIDPNVMTVMSKKVAQSGMFGVKNENQVYALMLIAESEGVHPMKAVQQFHIINGKPALKSTEVLSRFQKSGGTINWITTTDDVAEAEFSHPQGGNIKMKWDIAKAKKAGVYETNPVWKKYPANMLRARVITDAINALYPACLNGCLTESQAQDMPVEDDTIEEVEIVEDSSDLDALKIQLGVKLKKLNYTGAMIKEFAEKYNLANDGEAIKELLENDEKFNKIIEEFENGN